MTSALPRDFLLPTLVILPLTSQTLRVRLCNEVSQYAKGNDPRFEFCCRTAYRPINPVGGFLSAIHHRQPSKGQGGGELFSLHLFRSFSS